MSTLAIVLAADVPSRIARPAGTLTGPIRSVLHEALAAQCERVAIVVAECDRSAVRGFSDPRLEILSNVAWDEGSASFIRCGVAWAQREGCGAVLLIPCGQPLPTATHLNRLIGAHTSARNAGGAVIASCCEGALVLPALFGRPLFPALLSLRGEEGPRRLLKTFESVAVDWPEGGLGLETPDELLRRVGDLHVGRGTHGAS